MEIANYVLSIINAIFETIANIIKNFVGIVTEEEEEIITDNSGVIIITTP